MSYSSLVKKCCKFPVALLGLLLVAFLNLTEPGAVFAEQSDTIEITGEGVTTPVTLTLDQLQAMEQYQHVYNKHLALEKWYVARGVIGTWLLAGLKEGATRQVSVEGRLRGALTVMLQDKRYYYPV